MSGLQNLVPALGRIDPLSLRLVVIVLLAAVCGPIGYVIGKRKDNALMGALFGVFLGIPGLIIIALMRNQKPYDAPWRRKLKRLRPATRRDVTCPKCARRVTSTSLICRYCKATLSWEEGT